MLNERMDLERFRGGTFTSTLEDEQQPVFDKFISDDLSSLTQLLIQYELIFSSARTEKILCEER